MAFRLDEKRHYLHTQESSYVFFKYLVKVTLKRSCRRYCEKKLTQQSNLKHTLSIFIQSVRTFCNKMHKLEKQEKRSAKSERGFPKLSGGREARPTLSPALDMVDDSLTNPPKGSLPFDKILVSTQFAWQLLQSTMCQTC